MEKELFSPTEQQVIKLIHKKPISIGDVAEKVYRTGTVPLHPRNTIAGVVLRINRKCEYHKLNWFINGKGIGRSGKLVWRDKR